MALALSLSAVPGCSTKLRLAALQAAPWGYDLRVQLQQVSGLPAAGHLYVLVRMHLGGHTEHYRWAAASADTASPARLHMFGCYTPACAHACAQPAWLRLTCKLRAQLRLKQPAASSARRLRHSLLCPHACRTEPQWSTQQAVYGAEEVFDLCNVPRSVTLECEVGCRSRGGAREASASQLLSWG